MEFYAAVKMNRTIIYQKTQEAGDYPRRLIKPFSERQMLCSPLVLVHKFYIDIKIMYVKIMYVCMYV